MSTNPIDMLQTKGQMQAQDLQLKQNQITALKKNINPAEKEKKLREACEGFESIFIQRMWQQMRATLPQENPLVGREEKFWQSMYDQELAKEMASSGGIGLADMMYNQLSKNLAAASKSTADTVSKTKGFEISATPLMPLANANIASTDSKQSPANGTDVRTATSHATTAQVATAQVNVPQTFKTQTVTGQAGTSQTFSTQGVNPKHNIEQSAENTKQVAQATQGKAHSIYEGAAPHMGANPHDTKAADFVEQSASNSSGNSSIVEQYLANLQAKQAGNTAQNLPTGPELAHQAKLVATNIPPANGVLPNPNAPITGHALQMHNAFVQPTQATNVGSNASISGAALLQSQISGQPMANNEPHIIRTTYTTNIPANERSKRKSNMQYLTSGQPMVNNATTTAYAYGSKNVSNSAEQVRATIASAQQAAATAVAAPTSHTTGPLISSPAGPIVAPVSSETPSSTPVAQTTTVQNTQAPVVSNSILPKNINEG